MYFCPLCTSEVHRQGFGSLDSLKAHLDLYHCAVTGNAVKRHTAVLSDLESRIEKLVDSQLPKQSLSPGGASRGLGNKEDAPIGGRLLRKCAREFDLASAENDYLKRKAKEDARGWRLELEEERERYEKLNRQFRGMERILENACKMQTDGKKKLEAFVDRMVTDVDRLENQLEQANASLEMHGQFQPSAQQLYVPSVYEPTSIPQYADPRFKFSASFQSDVSPGPAGSQRRPGEDTGGRASGMRTSEFAATDSGIDEYWESDKVPIRSGPSRMTDSQGSRSRISKRDVAPRTTHDRTAYQYTEPAFVTYFDGRETETDDNTSLWKSDGQLDPYGLALILVFRQLDALDLLKCAIVCRKWCEMARSPLVWRTVRLKNKVISSDVLKAFSYWCTETVKLTLENVRVRKSEVQREDRTDKGSSVGSLEGGLEEIFRTCNDHLQFLKVVACAPFITDRALWLVACYCKNLQKVVYISDRFPANSPSIWALGASCRMLTTLVIPSAQVPQRQPQPGRSLQFDDEALLMISRCFPTTLKVLCIGGQYVTVTGLKYVAKSCQWLEALELDHCGGLSLRAAKSLCAEGLKSLQMLNFTHCDVSAAALKYLCDRLPQIRSIRVIFNWRDFQSPKHVETFLSDCQRLLDEDSAARKILRLEERI